MADIGILSRLVGAVQRNVDLQQNALLVGSLKVGTTSPVELTKTILTNLIALQNGSDFATGTNAHTHDGRYFTETELGSATGTSGAERIGVKSTAVNFTPSAANVESWLSGIDSALTGAISTDFSDSVFRISDNATPSKKIAFEASGITASNVRTVTMPDADVNLGALTNSNISASAAISYSKLSLSNSIVNGDINASAAISYSKLALSSSIVNADISASAAIAYSKLSLSSSIVNADISASAAIAYSKLALSSSIVNADINASAAIAYSKLALTNSISDGDINATAAISYSKLSLLNTIVNADIASSAGIAESKLALNYSTSSLNTDIGTRALDADVIKKNGSVAFTGEQSMGGFKLTNVADPSANGDAVTLGYMNARLNGLTPKAPTKAATTAPITLSGTQTIDGVSVVAGNRVLVKNQTLPAENGVYVVAAGPWSRATDMDSLTPFDEFNGAWLTVQEGSQSGQVWVQYGNVTSVGVDAINFQYYNPIAGLVGGDMITFSGSTFSVDLTTDGGLESSNPGNAAGQLRIKLDGSTLSRSATGLKVAALGITNSEISNTAAIAYSKLALSGSIVNGDINATAAISYSKLALSNSIVNADIAAAAAIAYSKLSLSNSIVNADIASAAAIAYSKLALSNSVVNADIAAAAAIARTKLASGTANHVLINDGTGVMSSEAALAASRGGLGTSGAAFTGVVKAATGVFSASTVVDADVSATAAIARTKVANGTVNHVVINSGTGALSSEAALAASRGGLGTSAAAFTGVVKAATGVFSAATIVDADVSATAAIAKTKLALANTIGAADLTTGVADQSTITGGNGTALAVQFAPAIGGVEVAGESFAATLFAVRFAKAADAGFVAGRVYKADIDASTVDNFYVVGLCNAAAAAGANLMVTKMGPMTVTGHGFTVGAPLFLSSSGAVTQTAPSTANQAVIRVGFAKTANIIEVQIQVIGVN